MKLLVLGQMRLSSEEHLHQLLLGEKWCEYCIAIMYPTSRKSQLWHEIHTNTTDLTRRDDRFAPIGIHVRGRSEAKEGLHESVPLWEATFLLEETVWIRLERWSIFDSDAMPMLFLYQRCDVNVFGHFLPSQSVRLFLVNHRDRLFSDGFFQFMDRCLAMIFYVKI